MATFTPTQGRYVSFIHAYTNLHGYAPAEAEISNAMCVSPPSVNQMVKMLERQGLISRQPGVARSIRVLVPEDEIPPWRAGRAGTKVATGRHVPAGGASRTETGWFAWRAIRFFSTVSARRRRATARSSTGSI